MRATLASFLRTAVSLTLCLVPHHFARADALDSWNASQVVTNPPVYANFYLDGVTWANGRYVAVGQQQSSDLGLIETSDDGINWTVRSPSCCTILDLFDVTYGNGKFVAVGWGGLGNPSLYCSTNGIDWVSTNGLIANFFAVAYGNGVFVAVGDGELWQTYPANTNRSIYTSGDGTNWTARLSGAPINDVHAIWDVAFGANQFIAVDGVGHIHRSLGTGSGWTRMTNSSAGSSVSFANNLFFISAGPGTNLVSTDGANWSLLANTTASYFRKVVYSRGIYFALAAPSVFTSTDGTNWSPHPLPSSPHVEVLDLAVGDRNAMVVGYLPSSVSTPYSTPFAYVSDPFVALTVNRGFPPQLSVSGLTGKSYSIDYLTDLNSSNWQTLTTFPLNTSPSLWADNQATNSSRFYRAVLLP